MIREVWEILRYLIDFHGYTLHNLNYLIWQMLQHILSSHV
jgi:hypothetical protein